MRVQELIVFQLTILNQIGDPNGGLCFIVCGASTVIKAVLFDELKRVHAPIFALGFHLIYMGKEKKWFGTACAVIPGYQVADRM